MRIRLSFSICLNLNNDIILADEVLPLQIVIFKTNVLNFKINYKKKQKIIFFVSHIRNLNLKICDKGVILKNGNLSEIYDIKKAYNYYDNLKKNSKK